MKTCYLVRGTQAGIVDEVGARLSEGAVSDETESGWVALCTDAEYSGDVLPGRWQFVLQQLPTFVSVAWRDEAGVERRWSRPDGEGPRLEALVAALCATFEGWVPEVRQAFLDTSSDLESVYYMLMQAAALPPLFSRGLPKASVVAYDGPVEILRSAGRRHGPCFLIEGTNGWNYLVPTSKSHEPVSRLVLFLKQAGLSQDQEVRPFGLRWLGRTPVLDLADPEARTAPVLILGPMPWLFGEEGESIRAGSARAATLMAQDHAEDVLASALADVRSSGQPSAVAEFLSRVGLPTTPVDILELKVEGLSKEYLAPEHVPEQPRVKETTRLRQLARFLRGLLNIVFALVGSMAVVVGVALLGYDFGTTAVGTVVGGVFLLVIGVQGWLAALRRT